MRHFSDDEKHRAVAIYRGQGAPAAADEIGCSIASVYAWARLLQPAVRMRRYAYSNKARIEAVERSMEHGVLATAEELGISRGALTQWRREYADLIRSLNTDDELEQTAKRLEAAGVPRAEIMTRLNVSYTWIRKVLGRQHDAAPEPERLPLPPSGRAHGPLSLAPRTGTPMRSDRVLAALKLQRSGHSVQSIAEQLETNEQGAMQLIRDAVVAFALNNRGDAVYAPIALHPDFVARYTAEAARLAAKGEDTTCCLSALAEHLAAWLQEAKAA